MRAMKRTLTALTLGGFTLATGPAMAGGLSQETANFAFDDSEKIAATEQVAKLSEKEMKDTKGELLPALALGGAFGLSTYTGYSLISDHTTWNARDAVASTAFGAAGGAFGGPLAASARTAARAGIETGGALGLGVGDTLNDVW